MYTWVIVINKKGEQKSPTQTETNKKKQLERLRGNGFCREQETLDNIFFFLPSNTREELLC